MEVYDQLEFWWIYVLVYKINLNDVVAYGNWMLHTRISHNFLTELNKLLCALP